MNSPGLASSSADTQSPSNAASNTRSFSVWKGYTDVTTQPVSSSVAARAAVPTVQCHRLGVGDSIFIFFFIECVVCVGSLFPATSGAIFPQIIGRGRREPVSRTKREFRPDGIIARAGSEKFFAFGESRRQTRRVTSPLALVYCRRLM